MFHLGNLPTPELALPHHSESLKCQSRSASDTTWVMPGLWLFKKEIGFLCILSQSLCQWVSLTAAWCLIEIGNTWLPSFSKYILFYVLWNLGNIRSPEIAWGIYLPLGLGGYELASDYFKLSRKLIQQYSSKKHFIKSSKASVNSCW